MKCLWFFAILLVYGFALAQNGPTDVAQIFGAGTISTDTDEFGGPNFTADGKTIFFSKSVPRSYFYTICVSHLRNGKWSEPEIAEFSGKNWDFDPVFSPDGKRLFFGSDRTAEGGSKSDFDIWCVDQKADGWTVPKNAGANVNSKYHEVFASASSNGTLYFASGRPESKGGFDIYRSRLVYGGYAPAERLPDTINTDAVEFEPLIAPDESFLLVGCYTHPQSLGGSDIFIAFNRNGNWTALQNLGPKVNTPAREYSPRLSPDGKYLYFASEKGYLSAPQDGLTFDRFVSKFQGIENGWGNLYQIELEPLKQEALKTLGGS